MKHLHILHLGLGRVGKELVRQLSESEEFFKEEYLTEFLFHGLFTSKSELVSYKGLSASDSQNLISKKQFSSAYSVKKLIKDLPFPLVIIDTTASYKTYPIIFEVVKNGGRAVLSNKKPLTGRFSEFQKLKNAGNGRLLYETVVGAGLPVIRQIKAMQSTGDEILEIQGCFSGTLGFIFSELEKDRKFSEIVLEAHSRGFTETDPREDLSGADVARKALILSRLLGGKLEMEDIKMPGLYPKEMQELTISEFLSKASDLDDYYSVKSRQARKKGKVLRFVAKSTEGSAKVSLEEVDSKTDIGSLNGPDNLIIIKSKRYFSNPLVIKGPGAGIEVTAAGVFADLLEIVKGENLR